MSEDLEDLLDLALALEGVSNSLQDIIDQDPLKRSTSECKDLITSVQKYANDIFNYEIDSFICLKLEVQNINCDINGTNQLAEHLDIFDDAINQTNKNSAEKQKELANIEGQLLIFESKENKDTAPA